MRNQLRVSKEERSVSLMNSSQKNCGSGKRKSVFVEPLDGSRQTENKVEYMVAVDSPTSEQERWFDGY